ncbi:MAG: response regulator [Treponema sp.]|jgi:two-component system response regulator YesN|nr:response regulator [Treponema sp.]
MILLIADDERNVRERMRNILLHMDLGFSEILTACDGKEALEVSQKWRPEVIITDIVMPGLSGHELAFKIQKENSACVIIFISGHDDVSYLQNAIDLHVFRYILKPIDIDKLVEVIHLAVEESHKRKRQNFDTLFQGVYTLVQEHAPIAEIRREHLTVLSGRAQDLNEDLVGTIIHTASLLLTIINEEQLLTCNGSFALLSSRGIAQCKTLEELVEKIGGIYDHLETLVREASGLKYKLILENACAYIEEHYMENIGAGDVAKYCGISAGYLSKLFSRKPFESVPRYITEVRLRHALDMIFQGKYLLTEIAGRCGFSSENYFSKLFRGRYGGNPSDIKKSGMKNDGL